MYSLPYYIEKAEIADQRLLFNWDNSDTQVAEGETDTDLVDRLSQLSQRANVAYATALGDWIVGRFRLFPEIEESYQYLESCWATAIDLRYGQVVWEDFPHHTKWEDPVKGPIWLAMCRLQQTIGSLVEEGDPEYTTSKLSQLALHIMPQTKALERWNRIILERLARSFPRTEDDLLGDVVPREFFDPDREVMPIEFETLINQFLRGLNPSENPFLNTPERLFEEGFTEPPYQFDITADRRRRRVI